MINLNIARDIRQKLKDKHQVEEAEIEECFLNREKGYLTDTREDHKSNPPTLWFVSVTDKGRILKVLWINDPVLGITIKSAYEPNPEEIRIYSKYA